MQTYHKSRPTHQDGPPVFPPVKAMNSSQTPPVQPTSIVIAGVEDRHLGFGFALVVAGIAAAFAV